MRRPVLVPVALSVLLGACASGSEGSGDPDASGGGGPPDAAKVDEPDADPGAPDAAPAPDAALAPDAAPGTPDAMPIDAMPPVGPPDTCAQAEDVTADALTAGGAVRTGDTTGHADDVSLPSTCTGYTTDGPDDIYAVTVTAGQTITATATPATAWDISLELVSPCAATPTCHDGSDSGFGGGAESVSFQATAAGTYYIAVDSYDPDDFGGYSVTIRVQ